MILVSKIREQTHCTFQAEDAILIKDDKEEVPRIERSFIKLIRDISVFRFPFGCRKRLFVKLSLKP